MKRTSARQRPSPHSLLAFHLDVLLRTIRCISQNEDRLCELLHCLQQAPEPEPEVAEELRAILSDVPSHEYLEDLKHVGDLLDLAQPRRPASRSKKPKLRPRVQPKAKKVAARKAGAKKVGANKAAAKKSARRRTPSK